MKPPTFLGGIEPLKAETWLLEMEKLFEVFPYTKTHMVLLATYTLKDEARRWWLLIRNTNGNMTWARFNEIFYEKYFLQCFRDRKVSEFQELKQSRMSVAEYKTKFTELTRFVPHMVDTDYKKAHKFEGGLDLDIFDRVRILKLPTYVQVLDRSLMAEATLAAMRQSKAPTTTTTTTITEWRGKRSGYSFRKGHSHVSKKQNTRSTSSSSQSSGSNPVCLDCERRHRGVCYRASGACFRCGKIKNGSNGDVADDSYHRYKVRLKMEVMEMWQMILTINTRYTGCTLQDSTRSVFGHVSRREASDY
ncbi:uncharacterized protein LOC114305756 [Camellia sinensis]|uniref:uncharacterized protein LOC114305756 n=1 Tax=Camellia sinensis TaxID=4442 RepID=UPI00103656B7|nr:uncharacterized protein LOC114305756 [Camellia sinensis]